MSKRLLKYSFFILVIVSACPVLAQKTDSSKKSIKIICAGTIPSGKLLYIIDGKVLADSLIENLYKIINPSDIAEISILKDSSNAAVATSPAGRTDEIIVTTKKFAVKTYQRNFSTLSKNYRKYLSQHDNRDDSVLYIVNGVIYDNIAEGILKLYKIPVEKIKKIDIEENPFLNGNRNKWIAVVTTK